MNIRHELLDKSQRKQLPDTRDLGFGILRTNHMFVADYTDGAWKNARIVPYGPFPLMPGAMVLHYGQAIFEGIKAFLHPDKELYVFRPEMNFLRLNHSAGIVQMPHIPPELSMEGLLRLLDVERDWCPTLPESSLYIRPLVFGDADMIGVKPSPSYTYCIMLSPCGPYYPGGFSSPLRLLITEKFHRAVSGGTGTAKTGGNYAASLRPAEYAHSRKCNQVLYLDASNQYLEEAGTMNHYHVMKDGTFVIPAFNDSVLHSITSQSVLDLAALGHIRARTEQIRIDTFLKQLQSGEIIEAGGFGTAAVVSPVGSYLLDNGMEITVNDGKIGPHSRRLYELYSAMQTGGRAAPEGWLVKVPRY